MQHKGSAQFHALQNARRGHGGCHGLNVSTGTVLSGQEEKNM